LNLIHELECEKAYANSMAAAARYWMEQTRQANMTLAIVVEAAGGHVCVHRDVIETAEKMELLRYEQPHDMTVHFRTRLTPPAA